MEPAVLIKINRQLTTSNILTPQYLDAAAYQSALADCRVVADWATIQERYAQYLHDESKVVSEKLLSIAFPESIEQVSALLKHAAGNGEPTTVSSARTGLAAGAVASVSSHLLCLDKLRGIERIEINDNGQSAFAVVRTGTTLAELNEYLAEHYPQWFFPVDPTETSASLGGMCATNASGARSLFYGSMRDWVQGMIFVLADGGVLKLRRGQYAAENGKFVLAAESGERKYSGSAIEKPKTKHTVGYCFESNIDAIELFVGAEGTLGVVAEVELRLAKKPEHNLFLLQFFHSDEQALEFVGEIREHRELQITALEFCDRSSLNFVASRGASGSRAARMIRDDYASSVYCEFALDSEEQLSDLFELLEEVLTRHGASLEDSAGGTEDRDFRDLKLFRHTVPETINGIIASRKRDIPALHKVATDMAVPDSKLLEIYRLYRETLVKHDLEFAIFGHAGNNHFHVNILPSSEQQLKLAKSIYLDFARDVVEMRGAVCAEHGVGRLKKNFLLVQYSAQQLEQMKGIKSFFDPFWLLNRGVLLDEHLEM